MSDSFWSYIFQTMSFLSGQPFQPEWELKARLILQAGFFLLLFCAAFFYFYRKYFWREEAHQKLFWWTIGILGLVVVAKFAIFYFAKGYIPDRLLFFGIPSPKFGSLMWFLLAACAFGTFLILRKHFKSWPAWKFLICLWLTFVLFAVGIAGMREGSFSIYEPFTRTQWEYAGDVHLVKNIPDFLSNYIALNPQLSIHGTTHPPGYVLALYSLKMIFTGNLFVLTLLITALGGLVIFPLYYFLINFVSENEVRRGLQCFIFIPSVVMFGSVSMDAALLFFTWLAMAIIYAGWRRYWWLSLIGGIFVGLALLMNFLFLLFIPVFLFFFVHLYRDNEYSERKLIFWRALISLLGFLAFFFSLHYFTGYSIIGNFFVANGAQHGAVSSNFASVSIYVLYALMNAVAFGFYIGLANCVILVRDIKNFIKSHNPVLLLGSFMILLFLAMGIFQGEVERIWLFITPLFILPIIYSLKNRADAYLSALISLLVFQVVVMQALFYTYW